MSHGLLRNPEAHRSSMAVRGCPWLILASSLGKGFLADAIEGAASKLQRSYSENRYGLASVRQRLWVRVAVTGQALSIFAR